MTTFNNMMMEKEARNAAVSADELSRRSDEDRDVFFLCLASSRRLHDVILQYEDWAIPHHCTLHPAIAGPSTIIPSFSSLCASVFAAMLHIT